jgi:two-component system sensor histidine kinase KdpD
MIADRFHAEMIVAYVRQPKLSSADTVALEEKLAYARSAGAKIEILDGEDPVASILNFARSRDITQVFIGHTQMIKKWPWGDPVDQLIRRSRGMDVRIFPQ